LPSIICGIAKNFTRKEQFSLYDFALDRCGFICLQCGHNDEGKQRRRIGADRSVGDLEHPSWLEVASTLVSLAALVTAKVCAMAHAWQVSEPNAIFDRDRSPSRSHCGEESQRTRSRTKSAM
jgi:hypothetical protein